MVNMAPPLTDLIAESTKKIIGDRLIDMFKTYKNDSYRQGRKARLKGFGDFLGNAAIDIIWSNMGQITMAATNTLYNFNWNSTDKQLNDQIAANNAAMAGSVGGLAANYIGRSAGIGVMGSIAMRYPKLDMSMLADAKEDNLDEIKSSVTAAIMAMRGSIVSSAILSGYMTGRQMLQTAGMGAVGNEPWILSEQVEKIAESEKDPLKKAAMSRFISELEDSVFDNFALISNSLSASYVASYNANKAISGPSRIISYIPDKTDPGNKVFMYGDESNIISAIESARLGDAMIGTRDVGSIVAVQMDRALKAERNKKIITIFFRNGVGGGTYHPNGDKAAEKQLVLSNVKPNISVKDLQSVLTRFDGGSWKVTAKLSDGHLAIVYAISESEGKGFLRKLVEKCCEGDIVEFSISPPVENINKRQPTGIFIPTSCWFTQHRIVGTKTKSSRVYSDGKFYETKTTKVNLRKQVTDEQDATTRYPWITVET